VFLFLKPKTIISVFFERDTYPQKYDGVLGPKRKDKERKSKSYQPGNESGNLSTRICKRCSDHKLVAFKLCSVRNTYDTRYARKCQ
jgi:hypothetical protein